MFSGDAYVDHPSFGAAVIGRILEAEGLRAIPEIQEEDIPKLSHYADKEANPLYPVPVLMDVQELEKFYYMLMPAKENTVQ